MGGFILTLAVLGAIFFVAKTFIVVSERENVIKERFGKFAGNLKPGFHFMVPLVDKAAYRHDVREQPIDVPPQSCITRDNIQVEVDGILYLKVVDAYKASYGIGNYQAAAINLAQTMMRSEIGRLTLDETFSERDEMNHSIVREVDKASDAWGIKVMRYEIMNISPSKRVIDTMEKQMEAERQKRANITVSQGEKEAKIAVSEGERTRAVNLSEGEKMRRINEATGRAEEIRLLAEAAARGTELVAAALEEPGGRAAVKMQLVDQYIGELGRVLETANVTVVPEGLAQMKGFFEGVSQVASVDKK